MYFPTSAATRLSAVPALPNLPAEPVLSLSPSPRKFLFCTVTRIGIAVWSVRPSAVLAYLSRTPTSLVEHGDNTSAHWSQDGTRIVIQTSASYLVLVTVEYKPDETVYQPSPLPVGAQSNFPAGPGEGSPIQSISLHLEGVIGVEGGILGVSPRKHYILYSIQTPPVIQRIPWPTRSEVSDGHTVGDWTGHDTWILNDRELPWLVEPDIMVTEMLHSRSTNVETWLTSDGRAYFVRLDDTMSNPSTSDLGLTHMNSSQHHPDENSKTSLESSRSQSHSVWHGTCVHDFDTPRWLQKRKQVDPEVGPPEQTIYEEPRHAVAVAINGKFSLIAIGTLGGTVDFTNFPSQEGVTPKSQSIQVPNPYNRESGAVRAMEWSSDGYVLAVGFEHGWAAFSVGGRCLASGFGVEDIIDEGRFQDAFMYGIIDLFWAPGNFELLVLARASENYSDKQLFVIPFAKSAMTGQHSPDNTRYAFLQMDDRALVYRGADQPDMSVINPESDVWQHIKIPRSYLATNWPIRYSGLSADGRLIAIAGRRGLVHYSSNSGRWKIFADEIQEQAFFVRGGLLWFHHVLIAAVEVSKSYQIRLYSRDLELSNHNILHREMLPAPVVILSLVDNSLLVYTADNTLYHFLIVPTPDTIKLHLCGSITFSGIISAPTAVRVLSWMIPSAQKQLGDPVDDLSVATVLMVVGGQLVLLRPRKSGDQEVKYDLQIFADRVEFCWIHLRGIGALENSLWGYDGQGIRVWLNALAIEPSASNDTEEAPESVKESVTIPLDFYPLSVLMDKGIIIGAEYEAATRSNLPFVLFRHATSSHLFLHHILLVHLDARQVREAVQFASHYQHLVYFAHALEILLHTVVESEATIEVEDASNDQVSSTDTVLPTVVEFLDHFDDALDVVVGCARKTEMTRWRRLFSIVGSPKSLFETCLASQRLKTAGSYLLVLHNLEQLDANSSDAVRLLKRAVETKDWQLCQELLRFLHSIDDTGAALRSALEQTRIVDIESDMPSANANGINH